MSGHEMHESLGLAPQPSVLGSEEFEGFELCLSRHMQLHCQIGRQVFLNP